MSDLNCYTCGETLKWGEVPEYGGEVSYCPNCQPELEEFNAS